MIQHNSPDNPYLLSATLVNYLREKESKTLKEIGAMIGVSESFVSRVARRESNFTTNHLMEFEKALGKPIALLLLPLTPVESVPEALRPAFRQIVDMLEKENA